MIPEIALRLETIDRALIDAYARGQECAEIVCDFETRRRLVDLAEGQGAVLHLQTRRGATEGVFYRDPMTARKIPVTARTGPPDLFLRMIPDCEEHPIRRKDGIEWGPLCDCEGSAAAG